MLKKLTAVQKIEKFRAELATAKERVSELNNQIGQALVSQLDGEAPEISKLRLELAQAEQSQRDAERALSHAEHVHTEEVRREKQMETERRFKEARELGKQRLKKAEELQKEGERLHAKIEEFLALGKAQFDLAPIKDVHFSNSPLGFDPLTKQLRLYYRKIGLKWAMPHFSWPIGEIKDLTHYVNEGNEWLAKFENQHEID